MKKIGRVCLLVAALLVVPSYGATQAQSTIDPTVFASPLSVITTNGGTVVSQHIEDNATAASDTLFLRPSGTTANSLQQQGRQTGYQAEFTIGTIGYVYSVSIYGTSSQAQSAFQAQHDFWLSGSTDPANSEVPPTDVGDPRFADWWTAAIVSNGTVFSFNEEFFTRGRLLVEVYLLLNADDLKATGVSAITLQGTLSRRLDEIAVTANSAPVVTPTAQLSPTPQPLPTAIPAGHKAVKCKKGYKVVKGTCQKRHKSFSVTASQLASAQTMAGHVGITVLPILSTRLTDATHQLAPHVSSITGRVTLERFYRALIAS